MNDKKQTIGLPAILLIVGIVLFKLFIWDEYIVHSTVNDALAEEDGEAGAGYPVSKNEELAIKPFKDGFKLYAVSKGYLGWKVTDEEFITVKEPAAYEAGEAALRFNSNKKLYVSYVLDRDKYYETVKANSSIVGEMRFDRSVGNGGYFNHYHSAEPLGDVEYEGIRSNGKVEKLK